MISPRAFTLVVLFVFAAGVLAGVLARDDRLQESPRDLADCALELCWTDGSARDWRHLRSVARRVAQTYGGQP